MLFRAEELIAIFIDFFIEEYGAKKSREIVDKIYYSPKILKFINTLRTDKLSPGTDGFINIVNSIPYFLFSKGETLCMGALVAIQKWLNESADDTFRISDEHIHNFVTETIFKADKTKIHLSGSNFFDKYYKRIENIINENF